MALKATALTTALLDLNESTGYESASTSNSDVSYFNTNDETDNDDDVDKVNMFDNKEL